MKGQFSLHVRQHAFAPEVGIATLGKSYYVLLFLIGGVAANERDCCQQTGEYKARCKQRVAPFHSKHSVNINSNLLFLCFLFTICIFKAGSFGNKNKKSGYKFESRTGCRVLIKYQSV
jgi:hypothetical protein